MECLNVSIDVLSSKNIFILFILTMEAPQAPNEICNAEGCMVRRKTYASGS
jgi:hypothetical protein